MYQAQCDMCQPRGNQKNYFRSIIKKMKKGVLHLLFYNGGLHNICSSDNRNVTMATIYYYCVFSVHSAWVNVLLFFL